MSADVALERIPAQRSGAAPAVTPHFWNGISAASLGSPAFKAEYGVRYACLAGAMFKGISSSDLVIAMGKAGFMGYFGAGGLPLEKVLAAIHRIQSALGPGKPYGMNLLCSHDLPEREERTVDLYLENRVRFVEAAAYMQVTPALVRYRLHGVTRDAAGEVCCPNRVLGKVSRGEVAAAFMRPPAENIVRALRESGKITSAEAQLAPFVSMADDICVEADSGGHTDQGVALALLPAMLSLRDEMMRRHGYRKVIRVGAAGGIGTPQAAAAAFIMGADFILTGSINQCTVEAGTSDVVKDLLQDMGVHDTAYAPAGDLFEIGSRVQVLKRGLFFPARANKLYELYQRYQSLEEIDERTRRQIEEKFFRRPFEAVWQETRGYYEKAHPRKLAEVERNGKQKMALIFKWYFVHSARLALSGDTTQKVDYQVHCGPALGAFNDWVRGSELQPWRNRRVANIAQRLMDETASLLNRRVASLAFQHKE